MSEGEDRRCAEDGDGKGYGEPTAEAATAKISRYGEGIDLWSRVRRNWTAIKHRL